MKVCFIGAGSMAEEHIKAFRDISSVNVIGIYSRTISKAAQLAEKYTIPFVCETIEQLANLKADIVVIAVSELSTKSVCFEAFSYQWTCLIEKPAGYNFEEAELIATEAKKKGTNVFVALNRRQYSSTKIVLKELAKSDEQRLIHISDQEDPASARLLGRPEQVLQNWMYANSIHLIDYFKILGRGHIVSVDPIIKWDAANPRFVAAKIIYSSGDIGIYEAVWNGPGPWAISVTTQSKRWELKPLEKAGFQIYRSRQIEYIEPHAYDTKFKPGFRLQAEQILKAVKGEPHELVSIEEALDSMRLVKQIYA